MRIFVLIFLLFVACGGDDDPVAGSENCASGVFDCQGICDGDDDSCSCENIDCSYLNSGCILGVCDNGQCIEGYLQSGSVCDDGNACTTGDVCNEQGTCVSSLYISCDDGISCTLDTCEPIMGCVHTPEDSVCDSGNYCITDVCNSISGCESFPTPDCP